LSKPDEATRNFFAATYAQPGGMRAGFAQFTAFSQDQKDNEVFERVKLTMLYWLSAERSRLVRYKR
jgi:hypothetical protein